MVSPKRDPQGFGSAITYAKRYSLSAILGLVTDEDTDAVDNKEPEVKEIDGDMHEYTDTGWQRTAEVQALQAQLFKEFRTLRESLGLSVKDAETITGSKLTKGLSCNTISNLIDQLLDYKERKDQNQLTDVELQLLTV
jgi:hypothetical protein